MKPEPKRIREIFVAAVGKVDPDHWDDFLEEAAAGDEDLLREFRQLLEEHQEAGGFLDAPASGLMLAFESTGLVEGPGTVIGPYKLMEQIGEGGMGVIYVAEQAHPVHRRVALKVIKPGMDSKQVVARFEVERQALAMMDHPNIAKILDGGVTESGRPYFVMELVRGVPITEYCDAERLAVRERLELFVLVCRAVQHAHQKGIIHRDLKPSNILVTLQDGVPVPRVIDFGIAKATCPSLTERTIYTGFAQIIGTPIYMSPEQVDLSGLDIDTRSDIYSLGILLYELLTGTTPFDSEALGRAAFDEMRRIIREEESPTPSKRLSTLGETLTATSAKRSSDPRQLNRSVRGELDWIAMKALDKDRRRRYETANDFASDVLRFLNHQPVEACPPRAGYRFRKFARRNRAAITSAALLAAALGLGAAASLWQAVLARQAKGEAIAAWAEESRRRGEVEQERNRAREAERLAKSNERKAEYSKAETQAFAEFLVEDMLSVARPEGLQGGLGIGVTVAQALEAAEANLETRFAGRPMAEATARDALGKTWRNLADFERAERHLRRAVELREREVGRDDPATLFSLNSLAVTLSQSGRAAEAIPLLEETLKKRRAALGDNHSDTLNALGNLGQAHKSAGATEHAILLLEEAWKKGKIHLGPDAPETLNFLNNLGTAYSAAGKFEQALPILQEAVERKKANLIPGHPDTLKCMINLAVAYQLTNQIERAVPLYEETLENMKEKFGPDHPDTLKCMGNLASAYRDSGRPEKAEPLFLESVSGLRLKLGLAHPTTQTFMRHLCVCYRRLRKPEKAEPLLRELTQFWRDKSGAESAEYATVLTALGQNLLEQERPADAEPVLRESLEVRSKIQPDAWNTFSVRSLLGASLLGQKKYAEAEPLLLTGHEGMTDRKEKIPPKAMFNFDASLERLVKLYEAWGLEDKADEWREALKQAKSSKPIEAKKD